MLGARSDAVRTLTLLQMRSGAAPGQGNQQKDRFKCNSATNPGFIGFPACLLKCNEVQHSATAQQSAAEWTRSRAQGGDNGLKQLRGGCCSNSYTLTLSTDW